MTKASSRRSAYSHKWRTRDSARPQASERKKLHKKASQISLDRQLGAFNPNLSASTDAILPLIPARMCSPPLHPAQRYHLASSRPCSFAMPSPALRPSPWPTFQLIFLTPSKGCCRLGQGSFQIWLPSPPTCPTPLMTPRASSCPLQDRRGRTSSARQDPSAATPRASVTRSQHFTTSPEPVWASRMPCQRQTSRSRTLTRATSLATLNSRPLSHGHGSWEAQTPCMQRVRKTHSMS